MLKNYQKEGTLGGSQMERSGGNSTWIQFPFQILLGRRPARPALDAGGAPRGVSAREAQNTGREPEPAVPANSEVFGGSGMKS